MCAKPIINLTHNCPHTSIFNKLIFEGFPERPRSQEELPIGVIRENEATQQNISKDATAVWSGRSPDKLTTR